MEARTISKRSSLSLARSKNGLPEGQVVPEVAVLKRTWAKCGFASRHPIFYSSSLRFRMQEGEVLQVACSRWCPWEIVVLTTYDPSNLYFSRNCDQGGICSSKLLHSVLQRNLCVDLCFSLRCCRLSLYFPTLWGSGRLLPPEFSVQQQKTGIRNLHKHQALDKNWSLDALNI